MILAVKICQKQSFQGNCGQPGSLSLSLSLYSYSFPDLVARKKWILGRGVQAMPTGELNPEKQSSRCRNYLVEAARQGVRNMMDV